MLALRTWFGNACRRSPLLLLLLAPLVCLAQPKNPLPPPTPLEPAEGKKQAQELVARLLAQKPTANSTNTGMIRIQDADDQRRTLPAKFEIISTPTNYSAVYEAEQSDHRPKTRLTIIHTQGQPNRYLLSEGTDPAAAKPRELTGAQLMTPFAGSDFWVSDLGLDFLQWPEQRVLVKEMRNHVFCARLQSTNPHPISGGYARVVSWIGTEHPDEIMLAHADAYDAAGKRLKQFDPKTVEKVNGVYQLESMEMLSEIGSRTVIEFNLKPGER